VTFSKAGYEAIISKIEAGLLELPSRLNHVLEEIKFYKFGLDVLGGIAGILISEKGVANDIAQLGNEFCERVGGFFKDLVTVPFAMWDAGNAWLSVASAAGDVASDLEGQFLSNAQEWQGLAAGAYNNSVQLQPQSAGQISSLAQTASNTCFQVAETGQAFGAAILLAVEHVGDSLASLDPGTVAGALSDALDDLAQAYTAFELAIRSEGKALSPLLFNYYEFPDGNWPAAVASS
jgi:hypothetical protein